MPDPTVPDQGAPPSEAKWKKLREPHLRWNGEPKIGYSSEQVALGAIPVVAAHQRLWEPTAYQCAECDQWHIGNESPLPEWPLRTLGATRSITKAD